MPGVLGFIWCMIKQAPFNRMAAYCSGGAFRPAILRLFWREEYMYLLAIAVAAMAPLTPNTPAMAADA